MTRTTICMLGIVIALSANAEAQVKMTLNSAIHTIAKTIKAELTDGILLKGKKVAIGNFDPDGGKARKSNVGVEIQQKLASILNDVRDEESDVTVTGSYVYTNGTGDNARLEIIKMIVSIKELGKLVQEIPDIEINETDDIYRVIGATGAPPEHGNLQERNNQAKHDIVNPEFALVDGHRVAAKNNPKLSVGVLKKKTFNGQTSPIVPENQKGLAFTNVGIGEYYEIELSNKDSCDVLAQITIDGLNVANQFTSDKGSDGQKAKYPGFIIHKGQTSVIKGWLNTVDQSKSDNVFTFLVTTLGQGADHALKPRGSIGVITTQFFEAVPPNGTLSRSTGGETTKGEPLDQKFRLLEMKFGDRALSTVSIRYNRE